MNLREFDEIAKGDIEMIRRASSTAKGLINKLSEKGLEAFFVKGRTFRGVPIGIEIIGDVYTEIVDEILNNFTKKTPIRYYVKASLRAVDLKGNEAIAYYRMKAKGHQDTAIVRAGIQLLDYYGKHRDDLGKDVPEDVKSLLDREPLSIN